MGWMEMVDIVLNGVIVERISFGFFWSFVLWFMDVLMLEGLGIKLYEKWL